MRIVLLVVVGALAVVAGLGTLDPAGWEVDVVGSAVDVPTAVGLPFRVLMQLGDVKIGVPVAALAAWWAWRRVDVAAGIALAGIVAWQGVNVLKALVERPRPMPEGAREAAHGFAYPSGHAGIAAALVAAAWPWLGRRARVAGAVVVALVGLARIHVGVHFPSDVLGGAAAGLAVGAVVSRWRRPGAASGRPPAGRAPAPTGAG